VGQPYLLDVATQAIGRPDRPGRAPLETTSIYGAEMKLDDFATALVAGNHFIKAGFGGMAGAGKSRTALEFVIGAYKDLGCTKPVLVLDNEKGARFLRRAFMEAGIEPKLKETTSLDDVLTAMEILKAGEVDFLFIDSLTKVWYRYCREYLEKNKKVFMELQDWGKLLPKWQETFSDAFVQAQGSIVFTGRGGFSYDKEEDTKDASGRVVKKGQFVKSGVKMKLAGETPFEPDMNVWMEQEQDIAADGTLTVWREAQIMKDRSGLIDGKVFKNPTYADFQPFVRYLIDTPTGAVAGESSGRNLAPSENFDGYDWRRKLDVALDEIKEEILRHHGHGMDAGTKAAKAETLERVTKCVFPPTGTRSWARVESFKLGEVEQIRNELWKLTRGHPYGEQPPVEPATLAPGANDPAPPEIAKEGAAA
jgi:hypothetical protein